MAQAVDWESAAIRILEEFEENQREFEVIVDRSIPHCAEAFYLRLRVKDDEWPLDCLLKKELLPPADLIGRNYVVWANADRFVSQWGEQYVQPEADLKALEQDLPRFIVDPTDLEQWQEFSVRLVVSLGKKIRTALDDHLSLSSILPLESIKAIQAAALGDANEALANEVEKVASS